MSVKQTVLIHLSDIHFVCGVSGSTYDLDMDLRNELERDAQSLCEDLEAVDGILVTGDIAYAGKVEEYGTATKWIEDLCEKLKCLSENVWTVPGNHDVDRNEVENSTPIELFQTELRGSTTAAEIDSKLQKHLFKDKDMPGILFRPIKNYNKFAAKFSCALSGADPLYWKHDLTLNDGSTLRLQGLNSTLVSNSKDNNRDNKLILGTIQATLIREEGVEYLTLCHHPTDWLIDKDTVEDQFNNRARIQLFGHKHNQRIVQINNSVRIIAGATHPDRMDCEWLPTYNILNVSVEGCGESRELKVKIFSRVWSNAEQKFVADCSTNGLEYSLYTLPLESWSPQVLQNTSLGDEEIVEDADQGDQGDQVSTISDPETQEESKMISKRKLTYLFFSLPYVTRIKIAIELDLYQDKDQDLNDSELFKQIFCRAKEQDKIEQLRDVVKKYTKLRNRH